MPRVGDVVKVNVTHPHPQIITLTLQTPEAAAYAFELLNDPAKSGWWLESAVTQPDSEAT